MCDAFTCGVSNPKKGAVHLGRKLKARDFTAMQYWIDHLSVSNSKFESENRRKKFRQKIDYKVFIKL